jgi:hypothetical protein
MPPPSDEEDEELPGEVEETRPPWWRRAVAYSLRRVADRLQFGRGARVRTERGEGRALAREARENLRRR